MYATLRFLYNFDSTVTFQKQEKIFSFLFVHSVSFQLTVNFKALSILCCKTVAFTM